MTAGSTVADVERQPPTLKPRPRPLSALGAPPARTERRRLGEHWAMPSEPGFGCAWRVGQIAVVAWPARGDGLASSTFGRAGGGPEHRHGVDGAPEGAELVAAFLTAEDCDAVGAAWDRAFDAAPEGGGFEAGRAARLEAARALAADRARGRARLLRDLRRGTIPAGSACVSGARLSTYSQALVRFPGGGGWWVTPLEAADPWRWDPRRTACPLRLLAVGLSEEDCAAVGRASGIDEAERILRERGLA